MPGFPDMDVEGVRAYAETLLQQPSPPAKPLAQAFAQYSKKGGHSSDPLLPAWLRVLEQAAPSLEPRELAAVAVAFRKLKVRRASHWQALCKAAVVKAADFDARSAVNMLNATAQHGYRDITLISTLLTIAREKASEFNSQDVANTLNAMTRKKSLTP